MFYPKIDIQEYKVTKKNDTVLYFHTKHTKFNILLQLESCD